MVSETKKLWDFMDPVHCKAVRDPVWHHIHVPDSLTKLLSEPAFIKLQGIRQLGPAWLVYPGATHTRFNHSIGVFQVAKRFLERIMADSGNNLQITVEGGKAFLAAALVHDLGHFPYTHSLKELALKDHEVLTAELVESGSIAAILGQEGIDPASVAAIVDHGRVCHVPELLFYRSVLSGVLDPDKLDYLNRDAYFCGVPYGIQDLDFILGNIFVHQGIRIGIRHAGIASIEHLLFAKYLMYRAVYWHRQVRTATAMIKQALHVALGEGILDTAGLYNLDDSHFLVMADQLRGKSPALELVSQVQNRHLLQTIFEIPYLPGDENLARLENLAFRFERSACIARYLSRCRTAGIADWQIVIDIPESISFESDMPVETNQGIKPYLEAPTVFTPTVVRDFTASLRMLRVMAPLDPAGLSGTEYDFINTCIRGGSD